MEEERKRRVEKNESTDIFSRSLFSKGHDCAATCANQVRSAKGSGVAGEPYCTIAAFENCVCHAKKDGQVARSPEGKAKGNLFILPWTERLLLRSWACKMATCEPVVNCMAENR